MSGEKRPAEESAKPQAAKVAKHVEEEEEEEEEDDEPPVRPFDRGCVVVEGRACVTAEIERARDVASPHRIVSIPLHVFCMPCASIVWITCVWIVYRCADCHGAADRVVVAACRMRAAHWV